MDNETSGTGNQYDYGFRIYNPRLGKFLSVDPLFKSYPWYTPYQFAGNMPTWAIDLDGLEPKVENGLVIGYIVQANQGPTQIAADLNDPRTAEKYGYNLQKKIHWTEVVYYNYDKFGMGKNDVKDPFNKYDEGYKTLNVNRGDFLKISQQVAAEQKEDGSSPQYTGAGGSWEAEPRGLRTEGFTGTFAKVGGIGLSQETITNSMNKEEVGSTFPTVSLVAGFDGSIGYMMRSYRPNNNIEMNKYDLEQNVISWELGISFFDIEFQYSADQEGDRSFTSIGIGFSLSTAPVSLTRSVNNTTVTEHKTQ